MKIYGVGVLRQNGTGRVIHDFKDGPFDTSNPQIIADAKRRGFSIGKPLESPTIAPIKTVDELVERLNGPLQPEEPKPKRKYEWKNPFTKKAKNGT